MRKQFVYTFALLLCPLAACAQADSVSLRGVEVTAVALDRNVTGVYSTQALSATRLKQLGIDQVADAVKHFAGVSVKDYGGIGGMKTVSIHSLGAQHTAVVYDGVTLSNTQAGQIDIGRYGTDNLQSVSLSVGDDDGLMVAARQYTAAGVLTLTTQRPHFREGEWQSLRMGVSVGSFGLVSPSLRWWVKPAERTALSLSAKMTRADGIYPYTLVNGRTSSREHRYNSDITAWQAEANAYHTFADGSDLAMKAYWYRSQRGLPGFVILYADPSQERMWDEDFFVQTAYARQLGRTLRLQTRLKYTHSWNRYRDWGSEYPNGERTDVDRQDEGYASATLGWHVARGLQMAVAQDVAYNRLNNNVYVNINYDVPHPSRWTSVSALALKGQWRGLKVDGSLSYTYAAERVSVGDRPADKHRLSPSLGVSCRLLAATPLYLRAMYKMAFRVPTFNDLYYRRLGNIHLRPETARQWSLGMTWTTGASWLRYLTLTADAYYHNVTDKIVAFPSTYVWRMANFGKVEILGADMTLGAQVDAATGWSLNGSLAATWQHAVDRTSKANQSYNNQLPYTPRWSGSGSLAVVTPWFTLGYTLLMQGSRYSLAQNKPEYRMPAFWEHSISLSRELTLGHVGLSLSAKVTNLTDEQYAIIQYYPMPGRQYALSAAVSL